MRIDLAEILDNDVPARDAHHVSDTLIRFRISQPLPVSPFYAFVAAGRSDVAALLPAMPHRPAVAQLLERARIQLSDALKTQRHCPLLKTARVETERDLARFNIEHFSEPHWLYTNGQGIVSVVERDGRAFEVVPHAAPFSSLVNYLRFGSEFEPARPLNASLGARFATLATAETWVTRWLGRLIASALAIAKGSEVSTAFFQELGARHGERQYPVRTFLIHHAGRVERVRVGPQESYAFLNRLNLDGFRARTCATCAHLSFSGMSWDMSDGQSGHCGRRTHDTEANMPGDAITSVFDGCEQHEFIEDAARVHHYLRR